jgi:hypothetical protein
VLVDDDEVGLNVDHLAAQLRDDLKLRAEVDRAKLFTGSKNRLRMRAHDLRATFITVSLASGRTWKWCQQRTGHGDAMKQKYRRTAATWTAQQQGDLAPMVLTIPELTELITPRLSQGGGSSVAPRLPKAAKVHGKGVEPLRLAAAEPKASRGGPISAEIRVNAGDGVTRSHEIARVETDGGQSVGNREGRAAALEAAIERVTRGLMTADDEVIPELVAERRAMRGELDGLRRGENVVPFPAPRRERP